MAELEQGTGDKLLENGNESNSQPALRKKSTDSVVLKELEIDVKDIINIRSFKKAQSVKPITREGDGEPYYTKLMPHCQLTCLIALILAVVFLVLGYSVFKENASKADTFKYAGFGFATVTVVTFISVIYINSVSSRNLIDTMKTFRRSKAANPQINKKLTKTNSGNY